MNKKLLYTLILLIFYYQIVRSQCQILYYWECPNCTIHYNIQPSIPQDWIPAIADAADKWDIAGYPCVDLEAGINTIQGTIDLDNLGTIDCQQFNGRPGVTQITTTNGFLSYCKTYLNNNATANWSTSGSPTNSELDVETDLVHEFGYWLGLDDNPSSSSTMGPIQCGLVRRDISTDMQPCLSEICDYTGVEDYITIYSGPNQVSQNSNVIYAANFVDNPPTGDYIVGDYHWQIILHHAEGDYVWAADSLPPAEAWNVTLGTAPYGYGWIRDGNNNVLGDVIVSGTDDKGIVHDSRLDIIVTGIPPNTTSGTLTHDETWFGRNNTITGNVIVPSGITLKILKLSLLKFVGNTSITINGTLIAQGDNYNLITFDTSGTSGNWGSIILSGSSASSSILDYAIVRNGSEVQFLNGANATIENSTIQNCTQGIYVYNSAPQILNNQIIDPQQNGAYVDASTNAPIVKNNFIKKNSSNPYYYNYQGIYVTNNSTPYVAHNEISGFDWGIYAGGGCNVRFSGSDIWNQNNLIANNYYGLASGWGSYVYAGYQGADGYNSIHNNINYDAYCYQSSYLYAEYNWWGGGTPMQYVDGSSTLDVNNILSTDPWNGIMPKVSDKNNSSVGKIASINASQSVTDSGATIISAGYALEDSGRINEAIAYYKKMIANDTFAGFALTELAKIKNKYSRNDVLTYLETLLPNTKYITLISKLIADIYLQDGQFNKAVSIYDNIISYYPKDYQSINSKFEELFAYINYKNDYTKAEQILTDINSMNLTDVDWAASIAMADNLLGIPNNGIIKKLVNYDANIPAKYSLSQNYPNPFNPSTIIHYEIPNDGLVTLKIYDDLGREVKTLVNQYQSKGRYDINFNASSLASGIYFYQLHSGNYISTKKLMLLK